VTRKIARRYIVHGRVQGVGFRAFVQNSGSAIGVTGWVRNLDDGDVEAYAIGNEEQLSELEARLWRGPRMSDVRNVRATEDVVDSGARGFRIR
jgi:acylphosphatase